MQMHAILILALHVLLLAMSRAHIPTLLQRPHHLPAFTCLLIRSASCSKLLKGPQLLNSSIYPTLTVV